MTPKQTAQQLVKTMPKSEVFNMDCMEFLKGCKDKQFDLAVVDPPYGINVAKMAYTQEDNRPCKQKNGTTLTVKKLNYKHGDWDKTPPPREYFDELFRVSTHQIIWGIEYFDLPVVGTGRIKWDKGVPEGVSFKQYETAFCSLIENEVELSLLWAGMQQAKSLSEPMVQQGNKQLNEKRIHPCHKPIMLYKWLLSNYAEQGQSILDTHLGSGSSRIAAYDMGFDFTGIELDKDYFDASCKRFELFKSQMKLF